MSVPAETFARLPGYARMAELDRDKIARDFEVAVNMAPAEIEAWLKTDESRKVGFKRDGKSESVGHASGKRIVKLLFKSMCYIY